MKILKSRTVLGVICIVASLLICFCITPLFNKEISKKVEIVRVVKNIKIGDKITGDMVRTVEVGSLNLPSEVIKNKENAIKEVKDASIEFENVTFAYSDEEEEGKNALENINLKIKSGETIGIIGGTGSSKSSLVQLIPRLYDVTKGKVKVGGIDVRNYDIKALRDSVAMVLQKNVLFSGTISENLRWGKKDADEEELQEICKLSQADSFIQEFPSKYDTLLDQGGTNLQIFTILL